MFEKDARNSELHNRWSFFKMHYLNQNADNYDEKLSKSISKIISENSGLIGETGLTESQIAAIATITGMTMRSMVIGLITDYYNQVHGPKK